MTEQEVIACCIPKHRGGNILYWTSESYGIGKVLRRYGLYPKFLPLNIYTGHGINLDKNPAKHELKNDAPVQLYFNKDKVEGFKRLSSKKCYSVISPFVYYRRKKRIEQSKEAKGTLVFPAHTTNGIDDHSDINFYIEQLKALPSKYKPLTICLHFADIEKGLHKKFFKHGFEVVTAGFWFNEDFIDNFYKFLQSARYVTSNLVGSYTFYAVEMGIPFFLYGNEPEYFNKDDINIEKGQYTSYKTLPKRIKANELFSKALDEVSLEQKEFVEAQLGIHESLSRIKLATILYSCYLKYLLKLFNNRLKPLEFQIKTKTKKGLTAMGFWKH